jgi:sugar phosphate isomerase/epimerase
MKLGLEAGKDTDLLAEEFGIKGKPLAAGTLAEKGVEGALAPFKEKGMAPCQIGAMGYNALSDDKDALEGQREVLASIIPMAADTGCRYISIGCGNHHPSGFGHYDVRNFTPDAIDAMARELEPMVKLAEKHDAILTIEPYLKAAINGPEPFKQLQAKLNSPALKANIDPSSLYDFWDIVDAEAKVREVCEGFAGHYGLVHLKEVGLEPGFHLKAGLTPIGEGPTDWELLLKLAKPHLPADGWIIIEHVLSAEEGRNSIPLIRKAAAAAGIDLE